MALPPHLVETKTPDIVLTSAHQAWLEERGLSPNIHCWVWARGPRVGLVTNGFSKQNRSQRRMMHLQKLPMQSKQRLTELCRDAPTNRVRSSLRVGCRFVLGVAPLIFLLQNVHADVSVTITANVTNAAFTVTGTGCAPGGYSVPQTLQWGPGASCTVAFVSPYSQQAGTQYVLTGWQDGSTANPRVIVTPAQSTTYTASFKTQYQLIVNVNPPTGGSVSGGGFVDAGGTATLTATAANGYRFVNWSGSITTSANPTSVQLNYSQFITANFLPVTNAVPGNWSVTPIATAMP